MTLKELEDKLQELTRLRSELRDLKWKAELLLEVPQEAVNQIARIGKKIKKLEDEEI
jgi:hypothetical protein